MRIVLFQPRGKKLIRGVRDAGRLAAVLPPLGLASMAAVLRARGHQVTILDAALNYEEPNDVWARRISALSPDFVGYSANTPAFHDAYDVCLRLRERRPSIRSVFGGVHVSWGREGILRRFPAIDSLIAGEGENSFASLVEGEDPASIPGLFYRSGAAVLSGPQQSPASLCAMDDLPFPAYDLLDGFPARYLAPLFTYPRHPTAHVISSRGCVYECSYCDRSVFHKSFRWNSPEYTFELVKYLNRDFGVRHVHFYDDLFTLNRSRVATLCNLLADSKLGVRFNCIVRIGHIDEELIRLLRSGGCWMASVGIESGDQRILDAHKEGLTLEAIRRDVDRLHKAGIRIKGLFMMGFPGETEESIRRTLDLALSLPLATANLTAFTPFPGAPITAGIRELGEFEEDWDRMDCVNFVFRPKEIASVETLQRYYREFYHTFYARRSQRTVHLKMLFDSPHSYWRMVKHAGAFLAYRKRVGRTHPPAPLS